MQRGYTKIFFFEFIFRDRVYLYIMLYNTYINMEHIILNFFLLNDKSFFPKKKKNQ